MKEKKLLSALVIGALVGTMTLVTSNSVKASDSTGITVKLTGNGDGSSWTYSNGYADARMDHKLNLGKNGNIPTKTDYDEEAAQEDETVDTGVDSEELQEEIEAEMNQHELDEEDMQDGGISEEAEEE